MTILSGFLYIKHGRVGTRSEGPDYCLQMADGEVFLQYEERMLWDPVAKEESRRAMPDQLQRLCRIVQSVGYAKEHLHC